MSINYAPDEKPDISEGLILHALDLGMQILHVICDEEDARVGDFKGVSFVVMVPFIPRQGERITLNDGKICEVKQVYYNMSHNSSRGEDHLMLVPNVYAKLIPGQ